MEKYSVVKRNELLIYLTTWMNLKIIIYAQWQKPQKKKYTVFHSIYKTL